MKFSSVTVMSVVSTSLLLITFPSTLGAALPSFQSGPHDGSLYSSGLVSTTGSDLFLTGVSYDLTSSSTWLSQCFVGKFGDTFTMKPYSQNGQDSVCRALSVLSDQQIVVVGTTGRFSGGDGLLQVGFGMTVGRDDLDMVSSSTLSTSNDVPYPQAVVVDPEDPDSVYVVSMNSLDRTVNTVNDEQPNWTHEYQRGQTFNMAVHKLSYSSLGAGSTFDGIIDGGGSSSSPSILNIVWSQSFPVNPSLDGSVKTVYVGDMIWKKNVGLIVAGSTSALGVGYGPAAGDDEDGYIAIIDPATGALAGNRINSQRFGTADFDIVTAVCDDPNDPYAFYVIGATRGTVRDSDLGTSATNAPSGSLAAFIKKVNVDTLYGDWTIQEDAYNNEAITATTPWGCAVDNDIVYVIGTVEDGAGMVDSRNGIYHSSSGQDDIWVAQYAVADGSLQWMQQVGTSGQDRASRGGGIAVDSDGNAVVLGDTDGALFRDRTGDTGAYTDIFVMTFARADGSYETTLTGDAPDSTEILPEAAVGDFTEAGAGNDDAATMGFVDPESLPTDSMLPSSAQVHQSGPNAGALYSSSLVYDPVSDQALIVGISYTATNGDKATQPKCLVARIEVGSMETKNYNILGQDGILNACRDIIMTDAPGTDLLSSKIVVVGNSDPGGLYADADAVQTGFGFSMDGNELGVLQGASLFSSSIPYPQAVVTDGSGAIYVASMNSNDVLQNANSQTGTSEFPNWTYLNKYGEGFHMAIQKMTLPNLESVWSKSYPVDPEADGTLYSVHVGGLVLKDANTLIVVGSTRAKGQGYGPADGDDEDGYMTLLDPSSGELVGGGRVNNVRIGSSQDDVIAEVCDVPDDPNSVIVVGATKGDVGGIRDQAGADKVMDGSLQWFAKKMNLNDLSEAWTIQGGAVSPNFQPSSTFAVGCHVDGTNVYVGGTVQNGASMLDGSNLKDSMGGNDVWVAQLDLGTGSSNWLQQFGSVGDDQLARNGGITTDKDGNVLIYGDTTGAFYRARSVSSNADIFLAVLLSSTGEFGVKGTPAPAGGPAADVPVSAPTEPPVAPPTAQEETNENGEVIPDDIVAIQLGPDVGPSYAGGMDYDPVANAIYLTGATYGTFSGPGSQGSKKSSCFFARMDMPELETIQRDTYGVDMVDDACSAIAANSDGSGQSAIMIGSTGPGGLLTELANGVAAKQYGFAVDLSLQHKFEFLGGSTVGQGAVTYPVALVADEESFWIVSMTSASELVTADYDKVKSRKFPNYTNGGVAKYGTQFRINVESFNAMRAGDGNPFAQGASQTFFSKWNKEINVGTDRDGMLVTGMITVNDYLIVVGSVHNNGDFDGFMAKVSREDGTVSSIGYVTADETSDDWIMNACADPTDQEYFYIVGASQGKAQDLGDKRDRKKNKAPVYATVAKINLITGQTEWQKQFNAEKSEKVAAAAYGCDVFPTENLLYIAGTVEDGARMLNAIDGSNVATPSAGGDDVFVGQLSTMDGRLNWMKQVGSTGDDRVARGGAVKVDINGNAIVFGETTGDLFRHRKGSDASIRHSDPFVMLFDLHHGIHQPVVQPQPSISNIQIPTEFFNNFTVNQISGGMIFLIILMVLLVLFSIYCACKRGCCVHGRGGKKLPTIYDADGYHDDVGSTPASSTRSSSSKGFGLFNKKGSPNAGSGNGQNLHYRDDDDFADDSGGLAGNFHKKYSDLPENGKEII